VIVTDGSVSAASFARPLLAGTNRSLLHMFDDDHFLARTNKETIVAAATFKDSMQKFSAAVGTRTFDANGLCQGMPFVWQALVSGLMGSLVGC
jgi:arachidonate 15-lipoxygenase (second type)/8-lipoxygenase (S-type)